MQRKTLHLPLFHAYGRGSGQTEEQGRQKAGQHREREGEKVAWSLCTVERNPPRRLMENFCFAAAAAAADSVPASERCVRAAVQRVCGAGLLRGPLPVPQSVRGPGHHG